MRRLLSLLIGFAFCPAMTTLAEGDVFPSQSRLVVRPSVVHLEPREVQDFHAVLMPARMEPAAIAQEVKWFVNGIESGNEIFGIIDESGRYQAPETSPEKREIHVAALSGEAVNPRAWATVILGGAPLEYVLTDAWEEATEDDGRFKDPSDMTIDLNGDVLISDYGASRIFRYKPNGEFIRILGAKDGGTALSVIETGAVNVNREGRVFSSSGETGPPRMQVFSPDETYEQGFATKGVHAGMVLNVRNIAFDSRNRIYTADFDNTRVNVYAPDYALLYSIGREGINARELNGPRGIAVDPNDELFVLSYYGPCEKRNVNGEVVLQFAEPDPVDGPLFFHDVVCDPWGNAYLATRGAGGSDESLQDDGDERSMIYKYNNEGVLLAQWTLSKKDRQARAIAIDSEGDVLVLFLSPTSAGVETYRAR